MVKIAPEDIKSNRIYEDGGGIPYKPYLIQIDGKAYAATRTSNKKYLTLAEDFLKNGPITQIDDYGIESWKAAGEDAAPHLFDEIPKMPDIAAISGVPLHLYLPVKTDTPVELYTSLDIYIGDPNKKGISESQKLNFEHSLRRNLLLDDANHFHYDIVKWVEFLEKEGYDFEKSGRPGVIGLGAMDFSEGNVAAAYLPEKGYMVTSPKFYETARNVISRYGLTDRESIEAMKRAIYLHENGHVAGIEGDRKNEKLLGELQARFYSRLAEEFKGTELERIYRALAEFGRDYAEGYSLSNTIKREITAEPFPTKDKSLEERLFEVFWQEAAAKGLEGKAKAEYIKQRRKETIGQLENEITAEYKGKTAKYKGKSNVRKSYSKERQEQKDDESDRAEDNKSTEKSEIKAPNSEEAPEEPSDLEAEAMPEAA